MILSLLKPFDIVIKQHHQQIASAEDGEGIKEVSDVQKLFSVVDKIGHKFKKDLYKYKAACVKCNGPGAVGSYITS